MNPGSNEAGRMIPVRPIKGGETLCVEEIRMLDDGGLFAASGGCRREAEKSCEDRTR
jgi:hypothetical protein